MSNLVLTSIALTFLGSLCAAQGVDQAPTPSTSRVQTAGNPASYASLLFDNGGFVTGIGNGAGGLDTSAIEGTLVAYGHVFQQVNNNRLSDDFTVPAGMYWDLSMMRWFGYQIDAATGPTSTITDVRVQVWNLRPDQPGAAILYGDTVTNRLLSSHFAQCYRVRNTFLSSTQRAVFELQIDLSWLPLLGAGTYWLDMAAVGDPFLSGPWSNVTVPWDGSDNSAQFLNSNGTWLPTTSGIAGAPCDFPFKLEGAEYATPTSYCTAKVNSMGCTPAIGSSGTMSATATSGFVLSAVDELNQKVGLVLYSEFGRESAPFGLGGILCVKAPTRRSKGFNAGGNTAPPTDCSGVFSIDFNAFGRGLLGPIPSPAPYLSVPGQLVTAQFWGRDPGFAVPDNFSLSNGLEFAVTP